MKRAELEGEAEMMQTVEAEISVDGTVTLLEPLRVKVKTRALVTVLETDSGASRGNAGEMLEFLRNNRLPAESRPSEEEIEAQIRENRNAWD